MILDFGLITELFPDTLGGAEHIIGGTPAYLSPEEGSGMAPSEAGDWYGVGATLYEALTGELPFPGPLDRGAPPQEGMRSAASLGARAGCAR